MGLLNYINNKIFTHEVQESEGLLSIAEKYIDSHKIKEAPKEDSVSTGVKIKSPVTPYDITKPFESFIAMCKELFLYKAGLYVENEKDYSLGFAYNLEDKTVEKSHATKSFWKGTLDGEGWQSFQKDELIVFYQLFSSEELESLEKLYFKRFLSNGKTFIFFTTLLDNSQIDFDKIEKLLNTFLDSIAEYEKFSQHTEQNMSRSELEATICKGLEQSAKGQYMELSLVPILKKISYLNKYELLKIGHHIYNVIGKTITRPNVCVDYPGKIKLVYFSNDEIDPQMLEFQIKKILQPFLNKDILDLLSISNSKSLETSQSILKVLLGK